MTSLNWVTRQNLPVELEWPQFRLLGLILVLTLKLCLFQACSEQSFVASSEGRALCAGCDVEVFNVKSAANKVDVLFVIDESSSMKAIVETVVSEFTKMQAASFPIDTRMAVTNTYPTAFRPDFSSIPDQPFFFSQTVVDRINPVPNVFAPGFNRLVSTETIAPYVAVTGKGAQFPLSGCGEWFSPKGVNALNQSCLMGNTQIMLEGIGVEPGLTSIKQLAEKYTSRSQALFRPDAAVNIIFISDTHDAGNDFYGHFSLVPGKVPSVATVTHALLANSPEVASLKFSGFVPLPPIGDSRLKGLKTLGRLPINSRESTVSSEKTNQYSYLPIIRETGGYATHSGNADMAQMVEYLVMDLDRVEMPIISLRRPIEELDIVQVYINGIRVPDTDFQVTADRRTIRFLKRIYFEDTSYQIEVRFK